MVYNKYMLIALLISLIAGLATAIGGFLATHRRMIERPYMATSLAFAAGAMLFVSFMELLPLGVDIVSELKPQKIALILVYASFFTGIAAVLLIDRVLPQSFNPSEIEGKETDLSQDQARTNTRLLRSGLLVAVVLALHNFPEGMSTFLASYQDISVGIVLAAAIAIHNIPEGIAVAAPVFASTKSRKKAVWWATLSGLTEPLGAFVAALFVMVISQELIGLFFGFVAGMMVFIAVDELLPAARRYQTDKHQVVYGVVAGMCIVAASFIIMK